MRLLLVIPNLFEAVRADICDGKAETAAVNRNRLTIGIDHQDTAGVVATAADENLRSPVIGYEVVHSGAIGLDSDWERIFGLLNFAQLGGQ